LTRCRSLHAEALQATVSEGLAQGPYVQVMYDDIEFASIILPHFDFQLSEGVAAVSQFKRYKINSNTLLNTL